MYISSGHRGNKLLGSAFQICSKTLHLYEHGVHWFLKVRKLNYQVGYKAAGLRSILDKRGTRPKQRIGRTAFDLTTFYIDPTLAP